MLKELHETLGAHFVAAGTGQIVEHYGYWTREYEALRKDVVAHELSHRTRVRVTGDDRDQFLNGMLSQNLVSMKTDEALPAVICTPTGKTLGSLLVVKESDSLLLDLDPGCEEDTLNTLNRYIITDDVTLTDISAKFGHITVQGPKALHLLQQLTNDPNPLDNLAPYASAMIEAGETRMRAVSHSRTGEAGFDLFPLATAMASTWQLLLDLGASCAGQITMNVARVEAGIPWYGSEVNDQIIPVEAGMEYAIDYQKGCFMGQEVIAKIKYIGNAPKTMMGIRLPNEAGLLPPGTPIHLDGKRIGFISTTVHSPQSHSPFALAFIKTKQATADLKVECISQDSEVSFNGETVALPLFWGTGSRNTTDD